MSHAAVIAGYRWTTEEEIRDKGKGRISNEKWDVECGRGGRAAKKIKRRFCPVSYFSDAL